MLLTIVAWPRVLTLVATSLMSNVLRGILLSRLKYCTTCTHTRILHMQRHLLVVVKPFIYVTVAIVFIVVAVATMTMCGVVIAYGA